MSLWQIILIVLGAIIFYLILLRIVRKLYRFPAPAIIGRALDSNFKRRLQPPEKIIKRSGVKPGMVVMDLGCGSGAYTTSLAQAVGESGKVYAVDIQAGMLEQLKRKLANPENQDITNIELTQADAGNLPFADESFDLASMISVLQETPERGKALREVKRVLKRGGILAVTEFLPDPDYPLRATTIKLGQREGFILDGSLGNLWHYTVRFRKSLPE